MEGSTAYVRVVDVLADNDPFAANIVAVTLSSFFAGDLETLLLTETGLTTGVFEGSIPLDVLFSPQENGSLSTSEFGGPPHLFDTLTATYNDLSGTTSTATATTRGSRMTFLDAYGNEVTAYALGSTVYLRIEDHTLNNAPLAVEMAVVEVVSLTSGDNEAFPIAETGVDTGIFAGSLPLEIGPANPGDSVLQAVADEVIEARHDDFFGFTQATDQALIQDAAIFFIDDNGTVTFELLEGGIARVRLLSDGDNVDPGNPDQVNVEIASLYGGDMQLVLLTETGAVTSVFEGGIQLASPWKIGLFTSNSGPPEFLPDQVTVKWDPGGMVSATATTVGARADFIDALGQPVTVYPRESAARPRIVDHNANDPAGVDSLAVTLTSSAGDSENTLFTETGLDTSIFTAVLPVSEFDAGPDDGILRAAGGDSIQFSHPHFNDPGLETAMATISDDPCLVTLALTMDQWTMISLPCNVGLSNRVSEVFGDDLAGTYGDNWAVFERDATNQVNVLKALTDPLQIGQGYWIKTNQAAQTVDVAGTDNVAVEIALVDDPTDGAGCGTSAGRCNMAGHPFNFDVCWADVEVIDGAATLSLGTADPAGVCQGAGAEAGGCVMSRIAQKMDRRGLRAVRRADPGYGRHPRFLGRSLGLGSQERHQASYPRDPGRLRCSQGSQRLVHPADRRVGGPAGRRQRFRTAQRQQQRLRLARLAGATAVRQPISHRGVPPRRLGRSCRRLRERLSRPSARRHQTHGASRSGPRIPMRR